MTRHVPHEARNARVPKVLVAGGLPDESHSRKPVSESVDIAGGGIGWQGIGDDRVQLMLSQRRPAVEGAGNPNRDVKEFLALQLFATVLVAG